MMMRTFLLCVASLTLLLAATSSAAGNHLLRGEVLRTGSSLVEGNSKLIMQDDCNLVLYKFNESVWASNTRHLGAGCYGALQSNGIFVIFDRSGKHLWDTKRSSLNNGQYIIILQNNNDLVIYGSPIWLSEIIHVGAAPGDGTVQVSRAEQNKAGEMLNILEVAATSSAERNHLRPGEILRAGNSLVEGSSRLTMQEDCNLVIYKLDVPGWNSNTHGAGTGCYVTLKNNGDFVIFDHNNKFVWSTRTGSVNNGNYIALLQSDGVLAIYSKIVWSTGTNIVGAGAAIAAPRDGTVEVAK